MGLVRTQMQPVVRYQLTETLQQIGRIGGSSSEEAANALRQLGQSIDGGIRSRRRVQ